MRWPPCKVKKYLAYVVSKRYYVMFLLVTDWRPHEYYTVAKLLFMRLKNIRDTMNRVSINSWDSNALKYRLQSTSGGDPLICALGKELYWFALHDPDERKSSVNLFSGSKRLGGPTCCRHIGSGRCDLEWSSYCDGGLGLPSRSGIAHQ